MMTSTRSDAIDRLELSSRRMNMNTPLVIEDCPQTRAPHVLGRPPICFAYLNPRRHILHLRRNTLLPDLQSSDAAAFKFLATPPPSTPNRRNLTLPAIIMNTPDALPPSCTPCQTPKSSLPHPLKRCAKCHSGSYCSRACQCSHWQSHKKDCPDSQPKSLTP